MKVQKGKRSCKPVYSFIISILVTKYGLLIKPRAADPAEDEVLTLSFQSKYIHFCKFTLSPWAVGSHKVVYS